MQVCYALMNTVIQLAYLRKVGCQYLSYCSPCLLPTVQQVMCPVPQLLLFANNFGTLIYVVVLACIFVELFLNKECTYLDDF